MLTLELYLPDRIVRGRLERPHLRPIDLLNDGRDPQLVLTGARAVAIRGSGPGALYGEGRHTGGQR